MHQRVRLGLQIANGKAYNRRRLNQGGDFELPLTTQEMDHARFTPLLRGFCLLSGYFIEVR